MDIEPRPSTFTSYAIVRPTGGWIFLYGTSNECHDICTRLHASYNWFPVEEAGLPVIAETLEEAFALAGREQARARSGMQPYIGLDNRGVVISTAEFMASG